MVMSVTNTYSMRRPIVLITFILIGGIAIGSCTEIPLYFTIGIGFIAWMCCLTTFAVRKFNKYVFPCLGLFFIVTSIAYYDSRTALLPANHLEHVLSTHKSLHRIAGTIINPPILWDENILNKHVHLMKSEQIPKRSGYKVPFTIRVEAIEAAAGWKEISGIMKVNLYPSKEEIIEGGHNVSVLKKLKYGQRLVLFGYAFLPKSPSNPCEFDYKSYLQRQMPSVRGFMTITSTENIKMEERDCSNGIYRFIYAVYNRLNNAIYTHTFSNSAPLISSMLLGNRADLSGEVIDNFMKTGIIHFIAVSGFNVGIVVLTVAVPLRFLGFNQTLATMIILGTVIFYAFLTGLNPPVLRASIMATVFFGSFLVRRQWDITSGIFTAIFVILVRNPTDLFNIGFQLSVLATVGIVYGSVRIEEALFKRVLVVEKLQVKAERGRLFFLKKYLRKSFCISLAAWLATLPVTAYYFHLFTPFVAVINILVFPLFWIIIICGIVLLTLGTVCLPLASVSAWLASNTNLVLESLVSNLVSLPCSYFYVCGPSPTEMAVYYLLAILLLYRKYVPISCAQIILFCLLSAHVLILPGLRKFSSRTLTITCLDVGHGCAIFIQFPNGKNILYDAGSWQNYDVGRYIIAPFLWSQHVKKIDLVILSHEHEDHVNGLSSLIERFQIKSVFSSRHSFASRKGQKILSSLKRDRICAASLSDGEVLKGFEPATIKIFNPLPFASAVTEINDNSCVLKIEYLGYSVLFCADIKEQGIGLLLSKASEIKSDIIQVPHHGSSIRDLEMFICVVQPKYAFINSNHDSVAVETLNILKKHGVRVLQTHLEGAITLSIDERGITSSAFLPKVLK
ncbi:MAG: DNA internalization-related competence protein ComEC/Rec2 [Candidatus Brocadia sp.]|nr:hypothetical protein [Candidatus Brocadia fulgida]MCE7912394.1 DNA internalization-related competence protein ComEC/Rec2 [Candidatus Brocadia sp. AMX3]MDG5995503.1 DNA internalization-related competence protein ComEC/Rec2 [Candidatus Brocadia sp.]RIJ97543.1 MAG: DNA internalization-related competence protein ComEC/Rec2 [Candidatus Brocadia sp.]